MKKDATGRYTLLWPRAESNGEIRIPLNADGSMQVNFFFKPEEVDQFIGMLERIKEEARYLKAERDAVSQAVDEAKARVRKEFGR